MWSAPEALNAEAVNTQVQAEAINPEAVNTQAEAVNTQVQAEAINPQAVRGMICLNFTKGGLRRGASQN